MATAEPPEIVTESVEVTRVVMESVEVTRVVEQVVTDEVEVVVEVTEGPCGEDGTAVSNPVCASGGYGRY